MLPYKTTFGDQEHQLESIKLWRHQLRSTEQSKMVLSNLQHDNPIVMGRSDGVESGEGIGMWRGEGRRTGFLILEGL